jgi:hypothetical protein
MIEGEGGAFRYLLKGEAIMTNRMNAIFKIENQEPLAHRSRLHQTNA